MTRKRVPRTPSFRLHKATSQGFVEFDGRRIYLGRADRPETRERYHRLVAEWIANGRQLPVDPDELSVAELIVKFWEHVEQHHRRPDGTQTTEPSNYRLTFRPLRRLYATAKVRDFGPRCLKAVRHELIELGWCRRSVNQGVGRIRRMFKWGVENELVAPSVYHALQAVAGLKRGRCDAHETNPIRPVADGIVNLTKASMLPTVAAMVELQRLTGMRPGEVCALRTGDLDTSGDVWVYRPSCHKMAYFGRDRVVFVGPAAQRVLKPFLLPDLNAHVFSPSRSERVRRAAMHAARKTPLSCGNRPGTNCKSTPVKVPGDRYTTESYGRAVANACDAAFPVPEELDGTERVQWRKDHRWRPNRLRHSFATRVRRDHGLESAQVLLGHASADVSQVYAERDFDRARAVALQVG